MILPDVNLLVFAYNPGAPRHEAARKWWHRSLTGTEPVRLPWAVVLGFVRIMTLPRVVHPAASPEEALGRVAEWLSLTHVKMLDPAPGHFTRLCECLRRLGTAGNLTTDAHLATLAAEYGLILQTTGADFARFPGIKWVNPLTADGGVG